MGRSHQDRSPGFFMRHIRQAPTTILCVTESRGGAYAPRSPGAIPPAFTEPKEDAILIHHPTFRDPDDEPAEPDMPETGETKPAEALVNDLESRLFKGRKVMVFGQITDKLARDVVARILALVDESAKPIQI